MTAADDYRDPLRRAQAHALEWLSSVDTRHVGPTASIDELMA